MRIYFTFSTVIRIVIATIAAMIMLEGVRSCTASPTPERLPHVLDDPNPGNLPEDVN